LSACLLIISINQKLSAQPQKQPCHPSVRFYDIHKDLEASIVKNVSGASSAAPNADEEEASKSDEDSNAEDDAASEQEDDEFIMDDDIELSSPALTQMLKPIPGDNKGIVIPPTQSAKETTVPGAVKDINWSF
jgi:hypothetical protein